MMSYRSCSVRQGVVCHWKFFLAAEETPSVWSSWICLMDGGLFIFRVAGGWSLSQHALGSCQGKHCNTDYQCMAALTQRRTHLHYLLHLLQFWACGPADQLHRQRSTSVTPAQRKALLRLNRLSEIGWTQMQNFNRNVTIKPFWCNHVKDIIPETK